MINNRYKNLLFLIPLILVFIIFIFYPFFQTIKLSFFKQTLAGDKNFIGLKNYYRVFRSDDFYNLFYNTLLWTIGATVLKVGSGLLVALLLYREFKFKGLVMMIVMLPWAMPYSVSHIIWRWIFDASYGHLNSLLMKLNIIQLPLGWLANPKFSLWGIIIANSWTGMPFCAFSILAGLYSIPKDVYDAASIDGTNSLQKFRYITLPMIKSVIMLITALVVIWTFTNFGAIWLMTKGGPLKSSTTFIIEIYLNAFQKINPGYASALSVISALFLLVLSSVYVFYGKQK